MKRIPYIADIHAENQAGAPLYFLIPGDFSRLTTASHIPQADGSLLPLKPCMLTHLCLMFERIADEAFIETHPKLESYESGGRQNGLRRALRTQETQAKERGYWELRDDPNGLHPYTTADDDCVRLQNAVRHPKGELTLQRVAFNYFPFAEAVCKATHVEEPVVKPANGAAKAEDAVAQAS